MNLKKNVIIMSLLYVVAGDNAQANSYDSCEGINLKEETLGTVCITEFDGLFKTVENGIQDLASGLVIMNEIKPLLNQYEATNYCSSKIQRLPTRQEIIALNKRGFRKAFNEDMKNEYLWTSSVNPESGNVEFDFFEGYKGRVYYGGPDSIKGKASARCVKIVE